MDIKNSTPSQGLIAHIIEFCAKNPLMTIITVLLMGFWGIYSLRSAPLDAIPDLSDPQVIVLTEWPGRSPDLVEDQVTYPIESALMNAPGVNYVRGQSFFGLSFVNVIFNEGVDPYWARSRILEYLATVQNTLPEGASPTLGPDATGVGWVYIYTLSDKSGKQDLAELRSIQDWEIRYALQTVPGVAEVATVGGFEKEYHVELDPTRLKLHNIALKQITDAIKKSNKDVGGGTIEVANHEQMIRGRGYIRSVDDLRNIPIKMKGTTPVLLGEVANVALGPADRRGIAEWNGDGEAVAGIVVMRQGENALNVINGVKKRLAEVEKSLPPGVKIETAYDRSDLILASIDTLKETLIEEMIVVSVIIFLFLLSVRSAIIPIITLPIAVLIAFIPLYYQGLTINIMSLGGIAVAIGAMVDASIIMIENIHKHLEEASSKEEGRLNIIVRSMQEVGPSLFFSLLLITISFLPVFTLQGTEGRLFKPLAFTKTYSMGFAAILAVTLTPALAAIFIRSKVRRESAHPISNLLQFLYVPVVRFVVNHRWLIIISAIIAMIVTIPAAMRIKSEFMPPLNEGTLLYMPSSPPGMSMTEASSVLQSMDRQIKQIPEVVSVLGKMGRSTTATDPAPLGMAETTIVLKPRDQWRPGMTWDKLVAELDAKVQYPGMPNIWWMPIQTRTEMLATGIRSPLAVQVFAPDINLLEKASLDIEKALSSIPGTRSVFAERAGGGFYLDIDINREAAARYGLKVDDIQNAIATAVGGKSITETVEKRRRYAVKVRYAQDFRSDDSQLQRLLIDTPSGEQIPLNQVAKITFKNGPPMIRSEGGQLTGFVFIDPGDIPMSDYVAQGTSAIEKISLPPGVRIEWTGQFRYLERAQERLKLVLPITLILVLGLLYFNTRSIIETAIVLLAVPFSLIGAFWLLYLLDFHMSVAVWVGLIALAGLDAETGVVMLLYLKVAEKRAIAQNKYNTFDDLRNTIVEGAAGRIRPKLMTVMTTMIGLTPLLWSEGVGADVMKRIAAPMVGGLVTSFFLELTVYPALFAIWRVRKIRGKKHELGDEGE